MVPEPVSPRPPAAPMRPLLTQSWLDLAFLHWAVDPADVAPLLPPGTVPDTFDGVSYVGLVAFRMYRVGGLGLPGIPYLGTFPRPTSGCTPWTSAASVASSSGPSTPRG